jgi:hypothetical protein
MSDALSDVLNGFFKLSSRDSFMANSTIVDLQGDQTAMVTVLTRKGVVVVHRPNGEGEETKYMVGEGNSITIQGRTVRLAAPDDGSLAEGAYQVQLVGED